MLVCRGEAYLEFHIRMEKDEEGRHRGLKLNEVRGSRMELEARERMRWPRSEARPPMFSRRRG